MEELQRLIRQQRRDSETDGMGRSWSKHKTYSVAMHYIRAPPKPLQSTRRAIYAHEKEGTGETHQATEERPRGSGSSLSEGWQVTPMRK